MARIGLLGGLQLTLRVSLGLVLLLAGIGKAVNFGEFLGVLGKFSFIPHVPILQTLIGVIIALAEIGLGLCLVVGFAASLAPLLTAALFMIFLMAVLWLRMVAPASGCGCFLLFSKEEEITNWTLYRTVSLTLLSFLMFLIPRFRNSQTKSGPAH